MIFIDPLGSINLYGVNSRATPATMEGRPAHQLRERTDDATTDGGCGLGRNAIPTAAAVDGARVRTAADLRDVSLGSGSQAGDAAKEKAIAALEKLGGKVFQDGLAPTSP